MHSKETEKTIADFNEFLKYKHPSSVLQFITSMMIGWTHFGRKEQPGKSDLDLAWNNYFNLLRNNIDRRLSFISSQSHSNARKEQKALSIPSHVFEEEKLNKIITLLGSMPPDNAIDFIVEVTTNWCFSIPLSFLPLVPVTFSDEGDESIANAIYEWLTRYYDLWN